MATPGISPYPAARPGRRTLRRGPISARFNTRVLTLILVLTIVLLAVGVAAMMLGSLHIPASDVITSVFGHGTTQQEFVVRTLRLPRVLVAIMVGAALATSGAIFQGLVRNPLVSPDIIGIDAGANLFVTFWLVFGYAYRFVPVAAFAGAVSTAIMVYLLSLRGGIANDRLILIGIGVAAAAAALTTLIVVRAPIDAVRPAQIWSIGSVYGADWSDVRLMAVALGVLLALALALTWPMRVLQLGEDRARSLGLPVERLRLLVLLVGSALAAVAVAVAGPVGFVALMIPHIARLLAGPLTGMTLLLTGLLGGVFLLVADVVGQHVMPVSLPVGVLTSAIGAPYFLFLLFRSGKGRLA